VNRVVNWNALAERGFRLPMPGVGEVPAAAYLTILVLFSLLIGPGNYVFLWRKRQQVLLVLTIPLLSAAFIVLLGGYAALNEGFAVRGRAQTFTMLDQNSRQAATRATVSLYAAGGAPSGGLLFPADVAVFPIGPGSGGPRGRQALDLTQSQRYTAGMIEPRAPANFEEVAFRTARERLTFNHDSAGVSVTNALGSTLTKLFYRDNDKLYTLSEPLPAGERRTLREESITRRDEFLLRLLPGIN